MGYSTRNALESVIPQHRLTRCALAQAQRLVDLFVPATDAQVDAQERIAQAVRDGDLYSAIETVRSSMSIGRRGLSTLEWREWAKSWLHKCEVLILEDLRAEKAA